MNRRSIETVFLKALLAFMVVCIHSKLPGEFGKTVMYLSRTAVPCFFMISGYYIKKTDEKKLKIQIVSILKLTILSSMVYGILKACVALLKYESVIEFVTQQFNLNAIINLLLWNFSPFSGLLWYLNALIYTLVIYCFFKHINKLELLSVLAPLLLLMSLSFGKYSFLFSIQTPLQYSRNAWFVGILFFMIGYISSGIDLTKKKYYYLILIGSGCFLSLAEMLMFERMSVKSAGGILLGTIPVALGLMGLFLNINIRDNKVLVFFSQIGKKHSTFVYVFHIAVIEILSIFVLTKIRYSLVYLLPILVYTICVFSSVCLSKLKKRVKAIDMSVFE